MTAPLTPSVSSLHYGQCPPKPLHLYSNLPSAPDNDPGTAAPVSYSVGQFLSAPAREGNILAVLMSSSSSPPPPAAPPRPAAQGAQGATPQSSA